MSELDVVSFRMFSRINSRLLRTNLMCFGVKRDMSSIQETISSNSIVVFVSSGCPYCSDAVRALQANGRQPLVIEASGAQRSELRSKTGSSTVPVVFVKGKFVGGCNDGPESWMGIKKIIKNNQLDGLLSG